MDFLEISETRSLRDSQPPVDSNQALFPLGLRRQLEQAGLHGSNWIPTGTYARLQSWFLGWSMFNMEIHIKKDQQAR